MHTFILRIYICGIQLQEQRYHISGIAVPVYWNSGAILAGIFIKLGIAKNKETKYNFKKCVRIIKSMREDMEKNGYAVSSKISSFGLESLLWNVDVSAYTKYSSILRYTFDEVVSFLKNDFLKFDGYTCLLYTSPSPRD